MVIAVFRENALYVAEDSQVMVTKDSDFVPTTGRKSFLSSTNSCITVTALVGTEKISFPDLMENIFTNSYRPSLSLEVVFKDSINQFYAKHYLPAARGVSSKTKSTRISLWAYDSSRQTFIGYTCRLDESDKPKVETLLQIGETNNFSGQVMLQGETEFLNAVLHGNKTNFTSLVHAEFQGRVKNLRETLVGLQRIDAEVVATIVELFELHIQHAKRLTSDNGWVGPPYTVYKITTNQASLLWSGDRGVRKPEPSSK